MRLGLAQPVDAVPREASHSVRLRQAANSLVPTTTSGHRTASSAHLHTDDANAGYTRELPKLPRVQVPSSGRLDAHREAANDHGKIQRRQAHLLYDFEYEVGWYRRESHGRRYGRFLRLRLESDHGRAGSGSVSSNRTDPRCQYLQVISSLSLISTLIDSCLTSFVPF